MSSPSCRLKNETVWANVGCSKIWESQHGKFLEVIINRNLNSNDNVLSICKKAGKKLSALIIIPSILNLEQ